MTADADGNVLAGKYATHCVLVSSSVATSCFSSFFLFCNSSAGVAGGSIYINVNGNWVRSAQEGNWSHGDLEATGLRGLALDYGGTCICPVGERRATERTNHTNQLTDPSFFHTQGCAYTFNAPGVTRKPTTVPTSLPTTTPSQSPSSLPSSSPSQSPSAMPTTASPTATPSSNPTGGPTLSPTFSPTGAPTVPIAVGLGTLVPNYDTCSQNWIAQSHTTNGSQVCALDEGKVMIGCFLRGWRADATWYPLLLGKSSPPPTHSPTHGAGGYLYMSYDQGVTFEARNSTGPQQWAGVANSGEGQDMLALTATGDLYKSTDSGVTWAYASTIVPTVPGATFSRIACNEDFSVVFVASKVDVIWRSTDGGLTWSSTSSPDGGAPKYWSAIDVSLAGTVVIGKWGRLQWVDSKAAALSLLVLGSSTSNDKSRTSDPPLMPFSRSYF